MFPLYYLVGNDITLSGIREIFESGILGPNCFIGTFGITQR